MLSAAAMGGIPAFFGAFAPSSLEQAFPYFAQQLWGLAFSGGALLALIGIAWRNRANGITMEQIGLVSMGGASATYATCLVIFIGPVGAWPTIWLFTMLAVAAVVQWWRLIKSLRELVIDDAKAQHRRKRGR